MKNWFMQNIDEVSTVALTGLIVMGCWGMVFVIKSIPRMIESVLVLWLFTWAALVLIKRLYHMERKRTIKEQLFLVLPVLLLLAVGGFGFYLGFALLVGILQYFHLYEIVITILGIYFGIGILQYIYKLIKTVREKRTGEQ